MGKVPINFAPVLFLKSRTRLSKPVWDSLQDWCKVLIFALHNLELTQGNKAVDISQNFVKQRNNLQPPGGQGLQLTQTMQH